MTKNTYMITAPILEILEKDLQKLKEEIGLYKADADVWILKGDVKNSAGTLTLHLTGNLKHFIGAILGRSGYVRQREKEFSDRNISREKLIIGIDEASAMVIKVLSKLTDEEMMAEYPGEFSSEGKRSALYVLMRLLSHFDYHLGQINYHRRLVSI